MKLNETHDPARRSWVAAANHPGTDFPIQNLPLGIFREGGTTRAGVAIGDRILDVAAALDLGFISGEAATAARAASGDSLNALMALGPRPASTLRARLSDLLRADSPDRPRVESHAGRLLVPMSSSEMLLPAKVGNFTDFVCSTFHAQRAARKPLDSPLAPVLSHMPVAYHGRASSVRISGEDVRRPHGHLFPRAILSVRRFQSAPQHRTSSDTACSMTGPHATFNSGKACWDLSSAKAFPRRFLLG